MFNSKDSHLYITYVYIIFHVYVQKVVGVEN